MKFAARIAQVRQAEQALDTSRQRASAQWQQVARSWRSAWTPGRIVIAGLALGYLGGRAQPLKLAGNLAGNLTGSLGGSGGLLKLLGALPGLLAGLQASVGSEESDNATDDLPPA